MTNLLKPFKQLTSQEQTVSVIGLTILILVVWSVSGSKYIPTPLAIIGAYPRLLEQNLVDSLFGSLGLCLRSIGYAVVIGLTLAYLSVIPVFRVVCSFVRKFRFLPSAGFSFLFMEITDSSLGQMSGLMVFGITTWLVDSMISVAMSISQDDVMYAKSLRMTRWVMMRELLVYGKASDMLQAVISNFAMAWMLLAAVENIVKANGGIGVLLAESNKYYRFDEVYAIQALILVVGILMDWLLCQVKGFLFPHTKIK